jgi:hypothetical protein
MSHITVYATTDSRLHADLVIVRLKQAGISNSQISILHPRALRPNSAICWMRGTAPLAMSSGEIMSVSGSLSRRLGDDRSKAHAGPFCMLGLTHEQSASIEESLLEDCIVVAVEVPDELDLPAIYHTLRRLAVRKVNTADAIRKTAAVPSASRWYRPSLAGAFGLAFSPAA